MGGKKVSEELEKDLERIEFRGDIKRAKLAQYAQVDKSGTYSASGLNSALTYANDQIKKGQEAQALRTLSDVYDSITKLRVGSDAYEDRFEYIEKVLNRVGRAGRKLVKSKDLNPADLKYAVKLAQDLEGDLSDDKEVKKSDLERSIDRITSSHDSETSGGKKSWTSSYGIITIAGLGAGFFFLGSNITGNVVGNLSNTSTSIIGALLLVIGFIAGYFWAKEKKSSPKRVSVKRSVSRKKKKK